MFKKSDEGRSIRIFDTNGAKNLSKITNYIIHAVISSKVVVLEGYPTPWEAFDGCFAFIDKDDISVGDIVILQAPTTTLIEGDERKVIGFVCEDKTKLVLEGILPGSWVHSNKVVKKKDLSNLRFKTIFELIGEYGIGFLHRIECPKWIVTYLGKNLSDIGVSQEGVVFIINTPKKYYLSQELLTEIDKQQDCVQIFIKERARSSKNNSLMETVWKEAADLDLASQFDGEKLDPPILYAILHKLINGETVRTKSGIVFDMNDLTINVNKQANDEKNYILPF